MFDGNKIGRLQETLVRQSELKSKLFEKVSPRYREKPVDIKENSTAPVPRIEKHASFGRIPSYLVKMAVDKHNELEAAEERRLQAAIPQGYRYMTAEEKDSTVLDLQQRRRQLLEDMKSLPLQIATLGQRRRKIELELKLNEIERTLEKLAQPKVLISSS